MRRGMWMLLFGLSVWFFVGESCWGGAVYWTSDGEVWKANLDGSGARKLGLSFVSDVALDLVGGRMFTAGDLPLGGPGPTGRIWVSDLEGGSQEALLALWSPPTSIELASSRYRGMVEVYWTDGTSIQVADENGGGMKALLGGLTDPCGISVDVAGGKMYWTRRQGDYDLPAVQRANLDGSEVEKLVVGYAGPTTGLALDVARGKMYWGYVDPHIDSLYAGFIMRSNLDGTEVEAVHSGLVSPMGLGLDAVVGMLYWSDTGALYRGRVDGTEREVIARGLRSPGGVAVEGTVPEPGVLVVMGVGILMLRRRH